MRHNRWERKAEASCSGRGPLMPAPGLRRARALGKGTGGAMALKKTDERVREKWAVRLWNALVRGLAPVFELWGIFDHRVVM